MINVRISEGEKIVYVEVSGYITSNEAKKFLNEYKQMTRQIRSAQYRLVVTPSIFECENNEDLRMICMSFFKNGYKKMYLVDPNNYIMGIMNLGKLEQKLFNKSVKVIRSVKEIR
ncbi:hypothetical protein [Romboutsia sp.]|uniref:hypothetical protein n=1 Tax=Romboutsia sp. TaxID=1965302 RepID=UPI002C81599D|nr:hypothetical protein [Romboutsia sp.]HSQ87282.1 hypothetical protein [Romboutsia sp.]